tara:strand:- start:1214 stop:1402 length:189 start_codon:yes stop_codon:yes gene_type:complete
MVKKEETKKAVKKEEVTETKEETVVEKPVVKESSDLNKDEEIVHRLGMTFVVNKEKGTMRRV